MIRRRLSEHWRGWSGGRSGRAVPANAMRMPAARVAGAETGADDLRYDSARQPLREPGVLALAQHRKRQHRREAQSEKQHSAGLRGRGCDPEHSHRGADRKFRIAADLVGAVREGVSVEEIVDYDERTRIGLPRECGAVDDVLAEALAGPGVEWLGRGSDARGDQSRVVRDEIVVRAERLCARDE